MDDRESRKRIETTAALTLAGGAYDWKTTPIAETEMARATDPVRLSRDRWWRDAEPRPLNALRQTGQSWLDNLKKFAARAHDDKAAEQKSIAPIKDRKKGKRRTAGRDEKEEFESYLPEPTENIHAWLKNLAVELNMNLPGRAPWFAALRSYVAKYTPETKARELDQNTLSALIRMICEEEEAA
jgi:hypothetical protein